MVFSQSRLGRCYVLDQAAWGTASSEAAADTIEAEISYPSLVQEALTTDTLRGAYYTAPINSGSKQGTTFSLTFPIHAWSNATPSGSPAALHPDALFLDRILGNTIFGGFSASATAIAGGTAAQMTVDNGLAAAFTTTGSAMLVPLASGHSVGWVQDFDATANPDTVDFKTQLSAAPASTGQIYGSTTTYLSTNATDPLTVVWQGPNSGQKITMYDCMPTSVSISGNAREQLKMTVELLAGGWSNDSSGTTATGAYATNTYPQLAALTGTNAARLVRSATSGSTPTVLNAASFELSLTQELAVVPNHAGNEGIAQFVPTNRTASLTMTIPPDGTLPTQAPGTSLGNIQLDLAGAPGQSFSILMHGVLSELETVGDSEGLIATTQTVVNSLMTTDGVSTNAGNSSVRVAWL